MVRTWMAIILTMVIFLFYFCSDSIFKEPEIKVPVLEKKKEQVEDMGIWK